MPLKDGIYRPASLLLLARAMSEPRIKPSLREASSKLEQSVRRLTVPESSVQRSRVQPSLSLRGRASLESSLPPPEGKGEREE